MIGKTSLAAVRDLPPPPRASDASGDPVGNPTRQTADGLAGKGGDEAAPYEYVGSELELFAGAVNWKSCLRRQIAPYIGRRVVEVGAGIGTTTRALWQDHVERWVSLEPDPKLSGSYAEAQGLGLLPSRCEPIVGTVADLDEPDRFDTVLYIDVLEHIEQDRAELCRAESLLASGGHLVVLAPAHEWLMCEFDRAVGHFRRYTRRSLAALDPPRMDIVRLVYLDSLGLMASLANKLLLRQSIPGRRQIAFWDRVLVRGSRLVDVLVGYEIGKSVLAVWRKQPTGRA